MKTPSYSAIILAAGKGTRLGSDIPKAFVSIDGKTILERALSCFIQSTAFQSIIVTVPQSHMEAAQALIQPLDTRICIISGGTERHDSVRNALIHLETLSDTDDFVVIHDAARCFLTPALLERVLRGVSEFSAVTTGIPSVDSLKVVDSNGTVLKSLDRNTVWQVQTPQAFLRRLINTVHGVGLKMIPSYGHATDDAALVEAIHPVQMILGEQENFKITTPHDCERAL